MKHLTVKLSLLLALVAMLGLAIAPTAAQDLPTNSITVTGYGQAFGAPDVAYVEVGVDVADKDVNVAFTRANDTMNAVTEALKGLGIAPEDLRTTNISVYSDYYNPETGGNDPEPTYRVNNTLRVTVRDISQASEVISTAVNAGANTVYNLSFGIADTAELEQQARAQAVEDARVRAQNLAELTGVTLGEPIIITEFSGNQLPPIPYRADAAAMGLGGGGAPVETGQLSVNVQVDITFAISG